MDKNEFTLESFKNIQELIKFTDQKSSGVLAVTGLELTVFLNCIDKLDFHKNYSSILSIATITLGGVTGVLLIYTLYISVFKILRPRLANHYSGHDFSLFYFNHLASMTDKTGMFDQFKNVDDDKMLRNLTDQIFEVSKILNAKINELHNSMTFLFYSIISLAIFILVSRFI